MRSLKTGSKLYSHLLARCQCCLPNTQNPWRFQTPSVSSIAARTVGHTPTLLPRFLKLHVKRSFHWCNTRTASSDLSEQQKMLKKMSYLLLKHSRMSDIRFIYGPFFSFWVIITSLLLTNGCKLFSYLAVRHTIWLSEYEQITHSCLHLKATKKSDLSVSFLLRSSPLWVAWPDKSARKG